MKRGLCAGLPYGVQDIMWGPETINDAGRQRTLTGAAQVICEMCPLRSSCLADAIGNDDQHGVFGGLRVKARRQLARLAEAAGIRLDGSERARSMFVAWLDAHPEAIEQARRMHAQARRAERGHRTAPLAGLSQTVVFTAASHGMGTTTATLAVAHALARAGRSVRVADTDPAAPMLSWHARAVEQGHTPPFTVSPHVTSQGGDGDGWTLIDVPAGAGACAALRGATLAVVVTRDGEDCLREACGMSHLLAIPSSVLVTGVGPEAMARAHAWLDERRQARTVASISDDMAFDHMIECGRTPPADAGAAALAGELHALFHTRTH